MYVRGVRGAITAEENTVSSITNNTKQLLQEIIEQNSLNLEDVISCLFTATPDLDAAYPALAAREIGWGMIPLICLNEMVVKGSLQKVIRVLLHIKTYKKQDEIKHVYLKKAKILRPDLTND